MTGNYVAALFCALTMAGFGCKEKRRGHCPKYTQVRRVPAQAGDVIVAEVNGRPILASTVRHLAQDKGLTAEQAVQQLIDDELMVQEAERRGLHRDPEVVQAGKQAAIYHLLAQTFEKDFTPAKVPDSELRRIYKRKSRRWFNRPELRRYSHAYLTRPWFKQNRRWYIDIEKDRQLKRVIENFQQLATQKKPQTKEAFQALVADFHQGDQTLNVGSSLNAHKDLRKPFADVLFALKKPGDISEVIATRPWYHVAFLIEIQPRKAITFSQAKEDIRTKMFPHVRKKAFRSWVNTVKKQCTIRVKPENLPVGTPAVTPDIGSRR